MKKAGLTVESHQPAFFIDLHNRLVLKNDTPPSLKLSKNSCKRKHNCVKS